MNRTLLIAEIGVNHNLSLDTAYRLADIAKECGADCVKTQVEFPTEYTLTYDETFKLYEHCQNIGIPFACTAFDVPSLNFLLESCKMPFLKLSSANWGEGVVEKIATLDMPVIMSTRNSDDLNMRSALMRPNTTLLHCVGEYPTPFEKSNLSRIAELCSMDFPVGFSDHSGEPFLPALAVAAGASVIEVHLTLDTNSIGPDHTSSLDPRGFKLMVGMVRDTEKAMHAA